LPPSNNSLSNPFDAEDTGIFGPKIFQFSMPQNNRNANLSPTTDGNFGRMWLQLPKFSDVRATRLQSQTCARRQKHRRARRDVVAPPLKGPTSTTTRSKSSKKCQNPHNYCPTTPELTKNFRRNDVTHDSICDCSPASSNLLLSLPRLGPFESGLSGAPRGQRVQIFLPFLARF